LTLSAPEDIVTGGVANTIGEALIDMGKHDNKSTVDGQGDLDLSKTKDVREAGGVRHSDEDKGEQGQQDDQE
jgi:hypothetical protein